MSRRRSSRRRSGLGLKKTIPLAIVLMLGPPLVVTATQNPALLGWATARVADAASDLTDRARGSGGEITGAESDVPPVVVDDAAIGRKVASLPYEVIEGVDVVGFRHAASEGTFYITVDVAPDDLNTKRLELRENAIDGITCADGAPPTVLLMQNPATKEIYEEIDAVDFFC